MESALSSRAAMDEIEIRLVRLVVWVQIVAEGHGVSVALKLVAKVVCLDKTRPVNLVWDDKKFRRG